jgi:hypothetical protein
MENENRKEGFSAENDTFLSRAVEWELPPAGDSPGESYSADHVETVVTVPIFGRRRPKEVQYVSSSQVRTRYVESAGTVAAQRSAAAIRSSNRMQVVSWSHIRCNTPWWLLLECLGSHPRKLQLRTVEVR